MRQTRILHALLGLFMGTAAQGCIFLLDFGDLEKGGGTGGAPALDAGEDGALPIPLDRAADALAKAICERAATCMGPAIPLLFFDEDCIDLTRKQLEGQIFAGLTNLDPTTFLYHPDRMPACVAALRAAPCDKSSAWGDECDSALEGMVAQGVQCTHPAQCIPGLFCEADPPCPGTCQPKLPEGSSCLPGACADELRCESVSGNETCVRLRAEGEACGGGLEPPCQLGMFCVGSSLASSTAGKCFKISDVFTAAKGLPCTWKGTFCGKDLYCEIDSQAAVTDGSLAGTCIERLGPGDACRLAIPDPCPIDYYCRPNVFIPPDKASVDGSCQKLSGPGGQCAMDSLFKPACASGNTCVGGSSLFDGGILDGGTINPGTCEAVVTLGTPCSQNEVCYSGYCGPQGKCAPPNVCPN